MVVIDMGFTDYKWHQVFMDNSVYFVTRLKSDAKVKYLHNRRGRKAIGVFTDQDVMPGNISGPLRLVCYLGPETGETDSEAAFKQNKCNGDNL